MEHGIIGCGRVAPNHVLGFLECGMSVTWCCDLDLDKAKDFSKKFNIPNYTSDYKIVLDIQSITSVSICTDHASHSKIAIDSLLSEKHVLVEKPMAINSAEAKLMIDTANTSEKLLSVVFQNRFSKLIKKIKEDISNGLFGEITTISALVQCSKENQYYDDSNWRGTIGKEGGSTFINQGIHTLDLILWIMGEPIYTNGIKSNMKFKNVIETEDSLAAILKFGNGAVCSFASTNASIIGWESYVEFIGTEGRICFTTCHPFRILKIDMKGNLETYNNDINNIVNLEAKMDVQFPAPTEVYYGVTHYYQILNFINSIENNEKLEIPGEEGYKIAKVVDAIYSASLQREMN